MILSLLGLSVYDNKSIYKNNTTLSIKEGEYINSIDVLLNSYNDEKFIFLGTKESIDKHKDKFQHLISQRDVEFIEILKDDLNYTFSKIISILIKHKNEKILFDITHSFRDSVLMSVIATILTQTIYNPNIEMIYAKEIKSRTLYQYEVVSEDILNTSNISTTIITFLNTLKVPNLYTKYGLNEILHNFSNHLVSNQFKDIYDNDLFMVKEFLKTNKDRLSFILPILDELEVFVNEIEATKEQENYIKFLFFTELFLKREYFLHSSTYLIEAITLYVGYALKEQGFLNFEIDSYKNSQKIVNVLKFNFSLKDFNFPNDYFVAINSEIFNKFTSLRDKIADIRHNLAHINIDKSYSDIEKELKLLLDEFRDLIKNRVLYNMDTTLNKQEYVVDYILSKYQKAIEQYKIKSIISTPKITTLFDKYKQNNIDTISGFDIERLKQFLKLNKKNLEKLFKLKEDRVLLVDDYKQYIIHHPQKKPKQKSQNEFRNQIRIIK